MKINNKYRFLLKFFLLLSLFVISIYLFFFFHGLVYAQSTSVSKYVYQDSLAIIWSEWLWDSLTVNYSNSEPKYAGNYSMAINAGRGWTAWSAMGEQAIDSTPYQYFTLTARSPQANTWWEVQFLDVNGNAYSGNNTYKFQPSTTTWTTYTIDLNTYNVSYLPIYGIRLWYVTSDVPQTTLYVDEMGFGGNAPSPTPVPTLGPKSYIFSVDPTKSINSFSNQMLGFGHGNWDFSWGKGFIGNVPGLDSIYKAAHVGVIRYAGGLWANWVGWERTPQKTPYTEWHPIPTNYFSSYQSKVNTNNAYDFHYGIDEIDSLGQFAQKAGTEVMIQVNMSQNDPYMWADMLHYTNIEKGYKFKYWELGNEIDLECQKGASDCIDEATYKTRVATYISALKAVDPSIIIVGGVPSTSHDIVANNWSSTPNLSRYLTAAAGLNPDALSYHWYTDCNATSYENIFTWQWTDVTTDWQNIYSRSWSLISPKRVDNEIIKPTGRNIMQGITELNTDACDFSRAPQNSNHIAALWYGDVLGRLAYNGLDFLTWYEGYGSGGNSGYPAVWGEQDAIPATIDKLYLRPTYYTNFMYGNFFGDQIVESSSPSPENVSVYASTDSKDPGTLKLMIVNISRGVAMTSISFSNFNPASGEKYEFTNPDPLNRTALSNGISHQSTINGFKLLSPNVSTAINQIPKRQVNIENSVLKESIAPYSMTAVVLHSQNQNPVKTGDANGDGKVDGIDYTIWLSHYQPGVQQTGGLLFGDFNSDKLVDGIDYTIWVTNYVI